MIKKVSATIQCIISSIKSYKNTTIYPNQHSCVKESTKCSPKSEGCHKSLPFAKPYSPTLLFTKAQREKIAKIEIHADYKIKNHIRDFSAEDTLAFDDDSDEEKAKTMLLPIKKFRHIKPNEETV